MIAPWNVRVEWITDGPPAVRGFYQVKVRIKGRWYDGRYRKSWWAAWWDGVTS